jgi:hypothetical protein
VPVVPLPGTTRNHNTISFYVVLAYSLFQPPLQFQVYLRPELAAVYSQHAPRCFFLCFHFSTVSAFINEPAALRASFLPPQYREEQERRR